MSCQFCAPDEMCALCLGEKPANSGKSTTTILDISTGLSEAVPMEITTTAQDETSESCELCGSDSDLRYTTDGSLLVCLSCKIRYEKES